MDLREGIMGSVLAKLSELLKEEHNLPPRAKEDLKYVAQQHKRLQAYFFTMMDAPPPADEDNKFDRGWLHKISMVFCQTDNIIDSLLVPAERPNPGPSGRLIPLFGRTRNSPIPPHPDPTDLIARIKEITLGVMDVFAAHKRLDTRHKNEQEKELAVCIDQPRDVLIRMLTQGDDISMKQNKIVSIVGLGGLGKTTLAQVVYHRLRPQFDCGAFVRVPLEPADMAEFFTEMFRQLIVVENHMNINEEAKGIRQLISQIIEFLLKKRWLNFTETSHQLIDVENHMTINEEAQDIRQLIYQIREFLLNKRWLDRYREVLAAAHRCLVIVGDQTHEVTLWKFKLYSSGLVFVIASYQFYKQGRLNRYLVVIDDLWNEDDWHSISSSLPNNDSGSRVITTTRVNEIAKLCCSGCDESIYQFHYLGYQNSRELFYKHYFRHVPSWPKAPGDIFLFGILKMCSGTPSAIERIASLLSTKVTAKKQWQEMMYSVYFSWKQTPRSLGSESENIAGFKLFREIISIIYANLPSALKDCLLYLAVHAKNQIIHRTSMVRKWIAEGFISENVRHSREEVASRYFDELINRNFIRLLEYDNYSREEKYEVNKMVLYALRQISNEENFAAVLSDVGISREYAHYFRLSVQCSSGSELSIDTAAMNTDGNIRSMTIAGPAKFCLNNDLVYLRVLVLDGCKDLEDSAIKHICRMTLLKYLSLHHTPVKKIPPEIRGLHYLETLDLRQTGISNLPPEIGKLQQLRTLDARQTKLSCLPPEIGKLQNLETLDVRQTQVKELPMELVHLLKLAYLYFGHSNSGRGVKLPVGSDQFNSVKVLGTVDSREWSESAMEEISGLTGVRELEVVLYDQPSDKDRNDKLLSSLGKCGNLENLIIYGDYMPSDELPVSTNFSSLKRLKVAGRFGKVPRWLAGLTNLRKLDIRVCGLDQDDLKILGGLPALTTLTLICIFRKKEEQKFPAGFPSVEVFSFDGHVPWITFQQGAMPKLKHLHLKLYAGPVDKFPSGIINLRRLEKITIRYSSQHASSGGITRAVSKLREQAANHGNLIKLSDNGDSEIVRSGQWGERTSSGFKFPWTYFWSNNEEKERFGRNDSLS